MKQKEWVDNYIRDHVNPVVQQHKELMEREAAEGEKTILKIKKLKHMLKNFHYRMSVKPLDIVNEKGDKVTMTIARRYPSFERLSEEEREKTKLLDYSEDNIS